MTPIDPRLLRRTRQTRILLVAAVGVGAATAAAIVVQAWLLATAIGATFATREPDTLVKALPWLALVFAGRAFLAWLTTLIAHRCAAAVKSQLRIDLMRARLERPLAASQGADAASLTMIITNGLDALDGYFGKYLPQLVLAVVVPLIIGVAIFSNDWLSAVTIAATLPLIPIFMILIGWATEARIRRRWLVQSRLAHHFVDLVSGLPTLQVFGRAKAQAEGLRRSEAANRAETMGMLRTTFLSSLALELLSTLSVALVAVGIGLRVVDGHLTLTVALFVLIMAPEAYLPLRQVGAHYHDAADGLAAAEQAFALIDAGIDDAGVDDADIARRTDIPDLSTSTLEVDGLQVTYAGQSTPALVGASLLLGPAEIVAITGPSGGGKSTLVNALLGLIRPDDGRILIGGIDLAELDLTAWRTRLAYVPQHPTLITGSVADNVALGAPDAPQARIRRALTLAGATHLDLARHLDAGECPLSAGELRRLALARALLRIDCGGGQLLILDEPTAGLDADAELDAIAVLRCLGVGVLVVSHRPTVLAAADRTVTIQRSELALATHRPS